MTHAERRLTHQLEDWMQEQFHAAPPGSSDAEILAEIRLRLDAKVATIWKRKFPAIMGPA